jgi:hypothetical protein
MSYLKQLKVPLSDLEERVIKIGVKEVKIFIRLKEFSFIIIYFHLLTSNYMFQGLNILNASLISTSALQNGLKKFLRTIKVEK